MLSVYQPKFKLSSVLAVIAAVVSIGVYLSHFVCFRTMEAEGNILYSTKKTQNKSRIGDPCSSQLLVSMSVQQIKKLFFFQANGGHNGLWQ